MTALFRRPLLCTAFWAAESFFITMEVGRHSSPVPLFGDSPGIHATRRAYRRRRRVHYGWPFACGLSPAIVFYGIGELVPDHGKRESPPGGLVSGRRTAILFLGSFYVLYWAQHVIYWGEPRLAMPVWPILLALGLDGWRRRIRA